MRNINGTEVCVTEKQAHFKIMLSCCCFNLINYDFTVTNGLSVVIIAQENVVRL